ncbi:DUF6385 domain-containing protein [Syntrophothermus lipocalidus]|uniref:DUF6385 domain-containing protein n=1 Tax=Syntrophothermus lipocalidus (strain DSM 12680 / TGB-C1) TaxID=643648 RepID=D7CIG9_SYNLT|nr:DUF6385 domain-containing protein [Syntrophothermus lipocalidus]ADI00834.1 hypothetical protein Slip_0027 [Syntrophothermus lipocalidus DSM 12680]
MPNNLVFNREPDQLKIQIYGSDTSNPISTTNGRLNIESISDTVSVTFTGSVSVTVTDLDIRDLAYTQDTVRIYGSETYPISTTQGRLNIESISAEVSITSTDLDIRDLAYTQDTVRIYGSETYPLATTTGWLNILNRSRYMAESSALTVTGSSSAYNGILASDISDKSMVSFAVHNKGSSEVSIRVEVSPDNTLWITDSSAFTLAGNAATVFVPKYFLKYARIAYAALIDGSAFTFDAWYQAQV